MNGKIYIYIYRESRMTWRLRARWFERKINYLKHFNPSKCNGFETFYWDTKRLYVLRFGVFSGFVFRTTSAIGYSVIYIVILTSEWNFQNMCQSRWASQRWWAKRYKKENSRQNTRSCLFLFSTIVLFHKMYMKIFRNAYCGETCYKHDYSCD